MLYWVLSKPVSLIFQLTEDREEKTITFIANMVTFHIVAFRETGNSNTTSNSRPFRLVFYSTHTLSPAQL